MLFALKMFVVEYRNNDELQFDFNTFSRRAPIPSFKPKEYSPFALSFLLLFDKTVVLGFWANYSLTGPHIFIV